MKSKLSHASWWLLAAAVAALIVLVVLILPGKRHPAAVQAPPHRSRLSRPATSHPVVRGALQGGATLALHGQVEATRIIKVNAPVAGKVIALGAVPGTAVTRDQLLVQLDSPALRAKLEQARAGYAQAEASRPAVDLSTEQKQLTATQTALARASQISDAAQTAWDSLRRKNPAAANAYKFLRQAEGQADLTSSRLQQAKADVARLEAAARGVKAPTMAGQLASARRLLQAEQAADKIAESNLTDCRAAAAKYPDITSKLATLDKQLTAAQTTEEQARRAADQAQHAYDAAYIKAGRQTDSPRRRVQAAEKLMAAAAIKAPSEGELTELKVRTGDKVSVGQCLAVIQSGEGARLVASTSPADLAHLSVGQSVKIAPESGSEFSAHVSHLQRKGKVVRVSFQSVSNAPLPAPGTAFAAYITETR